MFGFAPYMLAGDSVETSLAETVLSPKQLWLLLTWPRESTSIERDLHDLDKGIKLPATHAQGNTPSTISSSTIDATPVLMRLVLTGDVRHMLTHGGEAGSAAAARVVAILAKKIDPEDASRMFQHFSQALATAIAAAVNLEDGCEGHHGGCSHALRQGLDAFMALTEALLGGTSLSARLFSRSRTHRIPHEQLKRLELILQQLMKKTHDPRCDRATMGVMIEQGSGVSLKELVSDILSRS